ncbi:HNH endonuclease signature motif containing protein [Pseudonocardia sp. MH-G8]|uniref:HNH endonuclease signature motif containing protein n=1 Tax=Pseudonocardia sp. MH-G8 TaxID=1854588 RepID=UPI000BA0FF0A|nr:HNH endonuclease signature motif containing protein [Pseudonocardia sp. MH-G8]OZM78795.1 hypothetical protein CFP66_29615 [Pseudonocardia sp. MH-G8]
MAAVVELVDRAVSTPPGPELAALLSRLPWRAIPNSRLIEVLQARSRQRAHEDAEWLAGVAEVAHTVALEELPGDPAVAVLRAGEAFEWASHEIAAALTWTPTAADRELGIALALIERLPLVYAALHRGEIDRAKARVFLDYLDPANGDVTEEQCRRLCERFLPEAPGLTTRQLGDRLYRALHAIDPQYRRRRYRRAVQERGVALYLDPTTGTATLVGTGLPPDEASAAAERLDRLVEAAKRAGHPGLRRRISADLFLGMLNGGFHGLTEVEIIARLLGTSRAEDVPDEDTTGASDAGESDIADAATSSAGPVPTTDAAESGAAEPAAAEPADADTSATGTAVTEAAVTEAAVTEAAVTETSATGAGEPAAAGGSAAAGSGAATSPETGEGARADRWARDQAGIREGVEIRLGMATLAGLDNRPGEIPRVGPVGAHLARDAAAAQRRGAAWRFAVVDDTGHLLLAGVLRRRPRARPDARRSGSDRVRGGVVEVHLTVEEMQRFAADPVLGEWHGLLAEIASHWARRDQLRARLAANPDARFARGPLADHVRARDRYCCGPGCTRSARSSDLDHTQDYGRGGKTVETNIGPGCKRHHADKDRGWSLTQPEPGLFRWVSPLGRVYVIRGEPIRLNLPDPDPSPHPAEESDTQAERRLRRYDRKILDRPAADPPRPPPTRGPAPDDEPPF